MKISCDEVDRKDNTMVSNDKIDVENVTCTNNLLDSPLENSGPVKGSKMRMTSEGVSVKDPIYKQEMTRLMIQALHNFGFKKTSALLQEESGVLFESFPISKLRKAITEGDWEETISLVVKTHVGTDEDLRAVKFLIYEQQFLEFLEKKDLQSALKQLRDLISPLDINPTRVKILSSLLMSRDINEIKKKTGWEGPTIESKTRLLKQIQVYFPAHEMVKEGRLDTLINQSLLYQKQKCLFHNIDDTLVSLLEDHQCSSNEFPSHCVKVLKPHKDEVWVVKFSNNGKMLASGSKDKTVVILNTETWEVLHVFRGHSESLTFCSWSPDDTMLLTCGAESNIRLWNVEYGMCTTTITKHTQAVSCVAWFPDGKRFVSGGNDKKIYIWDLEGSVLKTWMGVRVIDLSVTNNGEYVVLTCYEKKIRIYGVNDDSERFIQESHSITSMSLSTNSQYVLVNLNSQEIHLWDLNERKLLKKYYGQTQGRYIIRSCFGGVDDAFIASGSEDCQVYIWHRIKGTLLNVLAGHEGTVNGVCWNPVDMNMFATASDDHTIRIWGKKEKKSGRKM